MDKQGGIHRGLSEESGIHRGLSEESGIHRGLSEESGLHRAISVEDIEQLMGEQGATEGGCAEMQAMDSMTREVSPEFEFTDDLPETASFNEALGKTLDGMALDHLQTADDAIVPSSIPEEQELYFGPMSTALAHGTGIETPRTQVENPAGEDDINAIESTQPSRAQAHMSDFRVSATEEAVWDAQYTVDGK